MWNPDGAVNGVAVNGALQEVHTWGPPVTGQIPLSPLRLPIERDLLGLAGTWRVLGEKAREEVLAAGRGPTRPIPDTTGVDGLFERQAARSPISSKIQGSPG